MFYIGELVDLDFSPGEESLETKLFLETEIPWEELAFPVVALTLKKYFQNNKDNVYPFTEEDIRAGFKDESESPLLKKSSAFPGS